MMMTSTSSWDWTHCWRWMRGWRTKWWRLPGKKVKYPTRDFLFIISTILSFAPKAFYVDECDSKVSSRSLYLGQGVKKLWFYCQSSWSHNCLVKQYTTRRFFLFCTYPNFKSRDISFLWFIQIERKIFWLKSWLWLHNFHSNSRF